MTLDKITSEVLECVWELNNLLPSAKGKDRQKARRVFKRLLYLKGYALSLYVRDRRCLFAWRWTIRVYEFYWELYLTGKVK